MALVFFHPSFRRPPQFASVLDLVSAGLGISIVPASTANASLPNVTFRPIIDAVEKTDVSIVYRKEESSAALAAFVAMASAEPVPPA